MTEFSRFLKRGSLVSSRRSVADFLTFRPESRIPRVIDLSDTALVVIERDGAAQETFSIPWLKTGVPLRWIGPVVLRSESFSLADDAGLPSYFEPRLELTNFRLPDNDPLLRGNTISATGETVSRRYVLGLGQRTPVFAPSLPADFAAATRTCRE